MVIVDYRCCLISQIYRKCGERQCSIKPLIQGAPDPKTLLFLFLSCSCPCPIHWSQVLCREWRYSWSNADTEGDEMLELNCGTGVLNTLRPRRNRRHFADDIFKCIFLNENVLISIQISLKFIPKGPINYIPALVQIMAWRRQGDKPLSEPMLIISLTNICVTRP